MKPSNHTGSAVESRPGCMIVFTAIVQNRAGPGLVASGLLALFGLSHPQRGQGRTLGTTTCHLLIPA